MAKSKVVEKNEPLGKKLWAAADKLRKNMDAAEYKHIVLGLIFLKYISDAFGELHQKLIEGKGEYEGANPEDKNEYTAEKVFYVPPSARWKWLQGRAKLPTIGKNVDDAMLAIEKDNPSLKGVLPIVFAQEKLDKQSLGGLIDMFATATIGTKEAQAKDVLGKVYEYFLGQFALAEGKKGGQFYTPAHVVRLLVEMIEPYEGRVFDPCCGSGGMFIQNEKFVKAHQDYYRKKKNGLSLNPADRISIYGQESNQTTWRLAKMNLAIRHIDSTNVKWNNEGSFLNDAHKDLKADYILANPPFNDSDWSGELLRDDGRWNVWGEKLAPPAANANYAWILHFLYHLAPNGRAGFVLAKGSLTTKTNNEGEIRKALIEHDVVECVVNLPTKLFLNTQIPACLWFITRNKPATAGRQRKGEILFIDARNHGFLVNRRNRELSDEDVAAIAKTFHNWRMSEPRLKGLKDYPDEQQSGKSKNQENHGSDYVDIPGFCKSATLDEVRKLNYVLTPGRYIGLPDDEDDFNFAERFRQLKTELEKQMAEENEHNRKIQENLSRIIIPERL